MDEASPPTTLTAKHFVLPGLPARNSQVLATACEMAVLESSVESSVDFQALLAQLGKKYGTNREECSQALENLQRTGYIDGEYAMGRANMRHFRVSTSGFAVWLKAAIDYPAMERAVAGACLNSHDSQSVAGAVALPESAVIHFLKQLDGQGYLFLSGQVGTPKTFTVRDQAGLKFLAQV